VGYVKSTAWPAITSSWRFWPLIHCLSFSNVIPTDFKLLFIDFMVRQHTMSLL
jgi:protein Mpv17